MKKALAYPIRVVLIYLAFSVLWIIGSDEILFRLVHESHLTETISIIKGGFYVFACALLIFFLLSREAARRARAEEAKSSAEETLRESEIRYQELFEEASLGIFQSTPDGKVIAVNPEFARMFGYESPEEAIATIKDVGMDIFADSHRREEIIHLKADNPELRTFDNHYRRKDGSTFLGRLNLRQATDAEGRVLFFEGFIEDITERKQVEETLRESEEKYRSLVEQSLMGIGISRGNQVIFANQALLDIFGYDDLDEFIKIPLLDHVALFSREMIAARMKDASQGKPLPNEFECDILRKDGRVRSLRAYSIHLTLGGESYTQTTFQDITERKQTEEALRASEERYRTLAEASPDMIFILNKDGRVDYINSIAAHHFHKRPEEVIGISQTALFPTEIAQRQFRNLKIVFDSAKPLYIEAPSSFGGKTTWLGTWLAPLTDPQGRVRSILGVSRDITERKRIEDTLRESQQMLQTVLDTIPVRVFWKDVNSRYIGCNLPFAHDGGFKSPADLIGKDDFQATWRDQAELYRADDRFVIESGQSKLGYEEPETTPGGSTIWVRTSKVPLRDAEGKIKGVLGTYEDITERKQAEERIKAALEEKEVLLREVHHRVKNNLQAMIYLIDMQSTKIKDKPTRQFLLELQEQARTMSLVYEQVYQAENLAQVAMQPYLYQIATGVLQTFGGKRQIQLEFKVADAFLDITSAMPCGLIVNELVTNAIKHAFPATYSGKPVIRVSLRVARNKVTLGVSDNGIGLPQGQDGNKGEALGMHLVNLWVTHQLGGTLDISTKNGTSYKIAFRQAERIDNGRG